ncbi:MAG: hypothetical protein AAF517_28555, partial [Planctomycetota bacterium]
AELFEEFARIPALKTLVVEVSFPDRLLDLANKSYHLTPGLLRDAMRIVMDAHPDLRVLVSHLKPRHRDTLIRELARIDVPLHVLEEGDNLLLD